MREHVERGGLEDYAVVGRGSTDKGEKSQYDDYQGHIILFHDKLY